MDLPLFASLTLFYFFVLSNAIDPISFWNPFSLAASDCTCQSNPLLLVYVCGRLLSTTIFDVMVQWGVRYLPILRSGRWDVSICRAIRSCQRIVSRRKLINATSQTWPMPSLPSHGLCPAASAPRPMSARAWMSHLLTKIWYSLNKFGVLCSMHNSNYNWLLSPKVLCDDVLIITNTWANSFILALWHTSEVHPTTSRSTGKCHPHRKVPDCTIPIQEAAKLLSLLVKVPLILESHMHLLLYVVWLNSRHHNSFLAATH